MFIGFLLCMHRSIKCVCTVKNVSFVCMYGSFECI